MYIYHWSLHAINCKNNALNSTAMRYVLHCTCSISTSLQCNDMGWFDVQQHILQIWNTVVQSLHCNDMRYVCMMCWSGIQCILKCSCCCQHQNDVQNNWPTQHAELFNWNSHQLWSLSSFENPQLIVITLWQYPELFGIVTNSGHCHFCECHWQHDHLYL